MNIETLFDRLLQSVDTDAYLTPSLQVESGQRESLAIIEKAIQSSNFDPDLVRDLVKSLHTQGKIDKVKMFSALHVIAAHPKVKDWALAARLVGDQEQAALELGGPYLHVNLASVDRHRGVLAYLQAHYDVALEYFSRAFEREHTAENLGNVLATLLALGDIREARDLVKQVRQSFPSELVEQLNLQIDSDPDLALLKGVIK